jgi:hypothetical protein
MTSPFAGPRSARQSQEIVKLDNPASEANSVLPADPEASSNAKHRITIQRRPSQWPIPLRAHVPESTTTPITPPCGTTDKDVRGAAASRPDRSIVDIFAGDVANFSRYDLANAYVGGRVRMRLKT